MQSSYKYYLYKKLTHSWNSATQEHEKLASHLPTFLERKYKVNSTLENFPRSRVCKSYMLLKSLCGLAFFMIENHQEGFWFFSLVILSPEKAVTWNTSISCCLHRTVPQLSFSTGRVQEYKSKDEALDEPEECSWSHCSLLLPYKIYLSISMHGLTDLRLVQIGSNSFDLN